MLPLTELVTSNIEFVAEIAFEKLNFPLIGFEHPSVSALVAVGQTTGLVLDCGYSSSRLLAYYIR